MEVLLSNETIWLTQKRMAELFSVGVPAISKHLKNIFESGELVEEVVATTVESAQKEVSRTLRGGHNSTNPLLNAAAPLAAKLLPH